MEQAEQTRHTEEQQPEKTETLDNTPETIKTSEQPVPPPEPASQVEAVVTSEHPATAPTQSSPAPPAPAPATASKPTPSPTNQVAPSAGHSLVYVLGQLGHDFGTEARLDSYKQLGIGNPSDPAELLTYLGNNPAHAASITFTLTQETTAIYAVQPAGPFASHGYDLLREFLDEQIKKGVERVSIPGVIAGNTRLLNGQTVPVVVPDVRGMCNWSTDALIKAVLGNRPASGKARTEYDNNVEGIRNFLNRIYYEIRNLGTTGPERAMNYAATNALQVSKVYEEALKADMKLDSIGTERSPICRPGSDCWDVVLTFFNPARRLEQARMVYRFTIDVSDIVPVTVGETRNWHVY